MIKRRKKQLPKWNVWQFRMAKLDVKPGDTVVMQTDLVLDYDQTTQLRKNMNEQLKPLKVRSILLTAGLKIGVIRKMKAS
jgi:hypothetical protein